MGLRLSKLEVTLHFRSGKEIRFRANELTKRFAANDLTALHGDDTDGWPFYFRLDEIEAITNRRVFHLWWD